MSRTHVFGAALLYTLRESRGSDTHSPLVRPLIDHPSRPGGASTEVTFAFWMKASLAVRAPRPVEVIPLAKVLHAALHLQNCDGLRGSCNYIKVRNVQVVGATVYQRRPSQPWKQKVSGIRHRDHDHHMLYKIMIISLHPVTSRWSIDELPSVTYTRVRLMLSTRRLLYIYGYWQSCSQASSL